MFLIKISFLSFARWQPSREVSGQHAQIHLLGNMCSEIHKSYIASSISSAYTAKIIMIRSVCITLLHLDWESVLKH